MATWTMNFNGESGTQFTLTIMGMKTEKVLTPADKPFTTRGDTSEDFFKPVRTDSGTIRVICRPGELNEIFGARVTDHKVALSAGGSVRWNGYVKQNILTQPYNSGYIQLEIPVVGVLEAMYGVYTREYDGRPLSLAEILDSFFIEMEMDDEILQIGITQRVAPAECLHHYFQLATLYPFIDGHCSKSWGEIWEDICNFYGFQMQYELGTIYFLSRDAYDGKLWMIPTIGEGAYITTTEFTPPDASSTILGGLDSDHKLSVYGGRRKVTVTHEVGEFDTEVWKFDEDELEGVSRGKIGASNYYFDFGTKAGALEVYPHGTSSGPLWHKLRDFRDGKPEHAATPYGGGIESIGWKTVKPTDAGFQYAGWKWFTGITVSPANVNGIPAFTIRPPRQIQTTDNSLYLVIRGTIRVISTWGDISDDATLPSTVFPIKVKYGDKYVQQGDVEGDTWTNVESTIFLCASKEENGKIVKFGPAFPDYENQMPYQQLVTDARVKLPSSTSGDLEITFMCPVTSSTKVGYIFEELEISLHRDSFMFADNFVKSENVSSFVMGNGNKDEYVVSSPLTVGRNGQWGPGVILDEPRTDQEGITEYPIAHFLDWSGRLPEESLATRIREYYRTSFYVYTIGTKVFIPIFATATIHGKKFAVVANNLDWRTNKNQLTLIEIK